MRNARAEQGTLIASGLMAGAAIFGIITAAMRVPKFGAPIRFISQGVEFTLEMVRGTPVLEEHSMAWYEGFTGQAIGLVMYVVLAFACFLLARLGARWQMKADGQDN